LSLNFSLLKTIISHIPRCFSLSLNGVISGDQLPKVDVFGLTMADIKQQHQFAPVVDVVVVVIIAFTLPLLSLWLPSSPLPSSPLPT